MWFGADAGDAHAFVLGLLGWMLEGLDEDQRAQALGALRATVAAHATPGGVIYRSAAWLIRARGRPVSRPGQPPAPCARARARPSPEAPHPLVAHQHQITQAPGQGSTAPRSRGPAGQERTPGPRGRRSGSRTSA